jgi:prevent-host-death family protein
MMMVAMEQAQEELARLIEEVVRGEHILITRNELPVAELVPATYPVAKPVFGSASGMVRMSDDFETPIEDFWDGTR